MLSYLWQEDSQNFLEMLIDFTRDPEGNPEQSLLMEILLKCGFLLKCLVWLNIPSFDMTALLAWDVLCIFCLNIRLSKFCIITMVRWCGPINICPILPTPYHAHWNSKQQKTRRRTSCYRRRLDLRFVLFDASSKAFSSSAAPFGALYNVESKFFRESDLPLLVSPVLGPSGAGSPVRHRTLSVPGGRLARAHLARRRHSDMDAVQNTVWHAFDYLSVATGRFVAAKTKLKVSSFESVCCAKFNVGVILDN